MNPKAWRRSEVTGSVLSLRAVNRALHELAVTGPPAGITGREAVLFLGPSSDASIEAWQVHETWDVQRLPGENPVAIHPDLFWYGLFERDDAEFERLRPKLEMELPAFEQAATAAHQARVVANGGRVRPDPTYPMLVSDANELSAYFREVGAYSDPASPPAQPPPVLTCANGTAVTDPNTNWGLVQDCETLLAAKDTLRGTATLNWSKDVAIGLWEGITISGGALGRVTKVDLSSESLSGTIPSELGGLSYLAGLDLSTNSLTGEIPTELGWLSYLAELRLSGNSLTGCIPLPLKDVATNDLSSLNLLYCAPPAPKNLTAGTVTQVSVPLSWDAVSSASKYRVEYRLRSTRDWTTDTEATAASHTVDELECDSWYHFRVSAYGSGTTYATAWSEPSATITVVTSVCTATESDEES